MPPKPRKTARYEGRQGREVVHEGITDQPLEVRQAELQKEYPDIKLTMVGRRTTREAAEDWEKSRQREKLARAIAQSLIRRM